MDDMNDLNGAEEAEVTNNEAANEEAQPEAEAAEATSPQTTEVEDWESVDDFIGSDASFAIPDPASVVTIRTSSGGDKYVPVSEATAVSDIIAQSGLFFGGAVQYYLNGAEVKAADLVPGGSTLTVIGSVKGGVR